MQGHIHLLGKAVTQLGAEVKATRELQSGKSTQRQQRIKIAWTGFGQVVALQCHAQ